MKNKKLVIALVALVAIAAIVLGVYFATRPATSEGGKAVTVTVVHRDGSEKRPLPTTPMRNTWAPCW